MQEEEIKLLSPLFLTTGSWLQVLVLCKLLDSSWQGCVCAQFLKREGTAFPSPLAESSNHLSISSKCFDGQRRPRFWSATLSLLLSNFVWVPFYLCLHRREKLKVTKIKCSFFSVKVEMWFNTLSWVNLQETWLTETLCVIWHDRHLNADSHIGALFAFSEMSIFTA